MSSTILGPLPPIQQEILTLQRELSNVDLLGLQGEENEEINKLRSFVLLVHDDVEVILTAIIAKKLYLDYGFKWSNLESFLRKIENVFKNDTLFRLSQIALDVGAIDKPLIKKLDGLRKLRIVFAHLKDKKYKVFEDEGEQLIAYKKLWEIVREIKSLNYEYDKALRLGLFVG